MYICQRNELLIYEMYRPGKEIKETEAFKKTPWTSQRFLLSKTNIISINKGMKKVNEIGFVNWENFTKTNELNKQIIKQIIKNKQ